ncbi:helix-turn-helix domain-containing protein [Caminicella sporogenes]|uniref:helix-turn-helix domain-containing protein n=1 Tax=Caminicella sporogenes TaxID=166485 RepID=UPI00253F99FF|nr:helix-turn-helix domain-containing protein [Caminicella sporogenes]WIF94297.1 helix-turn-helix domain-containing protein [Caminicella sporogenes]
MNKVVFNFKSNWFEEGVVNKIGINGLWIYFNIRKFKLQYSSNICVFSLDLLYKEIQQYYKTKNRKYSKSNIREIIFKLKKFGIIDFDRKYNMKNNNDLCKCELLDLPILDKNFKPVSSDDYYITVDTDVINKIFKLDMDERHIITYYCLRKFSNANQITVSYEKMAKWLGVSKNTVNKYCIELEENKIIANQYSRSQAGHKCNSFILTDNKNSDNNKLVSKIAEKNNVKRDIEKIKKELKNKNIKVTNRAFEDVKEYLPYLKDAEKKKISDFKKKHIVYAIKYLYFELLDELKNRKNNSTIEEVATAKEDMINNVNVDKINWGENNPFEKSYYAS